MEEEYSMAIKFNNIKIPAFVKVNNIKMSVLPPVSQNTVVVSGRAGSYDFGNTIGEKTIEVTVSIIADSPSDLRDKTRQFSEWLYTEEAKELVILDEPDKYYLAKFTGNSDMSDILKVGQGTISFICTDPHAYGQEKTHVYNPTEIVAYPFANNGGTDTYPKMTFEFTQDTPNFTIATDEETLIFGKAVEVDTVVTDSTPLVMHETFADLNGWTTATRVDDGVVDGTFKSNGYSISLDDAGEGSAWHGASLIKALPSPLQDFKIMSRIGLAGSKVGQLGRVQVYFLDINGNQIGMVSLRNGNTQAITPYAQGRLGGKWMYQTYGNHNSKWKKWTDGFMEVARRGNKWTFYYAMYDSKRNKKHSGFYHEFVDINNLYSKQIAQIQIHIGGYGTAPLIPNMYFQAIKVWSINQTVEANEVPNIIKQGDVLFIDNETGEITLNGDPFYEHLDPSSKFIKFKKGDNGLIVSPANITTNGEVKYTERWL